MWYYNLLGSKRELQVVSITMNSGSVLCHNTVNNYQSVYFLCTFTVFHVLTYNCDGLGVVLQTFPHLF